MEINQTIFPKGIAGAIANPATLGSVTNTIFSYPSSILRIIGGYGLLNVHHNATEPNTPAKYQVWIIPATLTNGFITESNVKIYNGTAWVEPTKELWALAIGKESLTAANLNELFTAVLTNLTEPTNAALVDNMTALILDNITFSINANDELVATY